eukprot:5792697-Amphidinium_carterae.1
MPWLAVLGDALDMRAAHEWNIAAREAAQRWRHWAAESVLGGGKAAHRFSKNRTADKDPEVFGEPMVGRVGLQEVVNFWQRIWSVHGVHAAADLQLVPKLQQQAPGIAVAELDRVLQNAPKNKSPGVDGWKLGTVSLLPEDYKRGLCRVIELWERDCCLPVDLATVISLLPKPDGTTRPIGLSCLPLRLWGKLRRQEAIAWEESHMLRSHWGGENASCGRAMWEHALRVESAHGKGSQCVGLFLDLAKFYEHVGHSVLTDAVVTTGFPIWLFKAAVRFYAGPRLIEWRNQVSTVFYVDGSVLAGCSLATTLVRVLLLPLLWHLETLGPPLQITSVVDDLGLTAEGTSEVVELVIARAGVYAIAWLQGRGLPLSPNKSTLIATQKGLRGNLALVFEPLGVQVDMTVKQVGSQAHVSKRRRVGLQQKRFGTATSRLAKLKRLRRSGAKVSKVVRAGPIPAALWGSAVQGLSARRLKTFRRKVARTWRQLPLRASPELFMAADLDLQLKDPGHIHHKELVERWATCVFREELMLGNLWGAMGAAGDRLLAAKVPWLVVAGPAGAFLLTCCRLDWQVLAPYAILDHKGVFWDMRIVSPRFMAERALEASRVWSDRAAGGSRWGRETPHYWWQPVHRAGDKCGTPLQRYGVALVAAGGSWTQEKLFSRGLASHGQCLLCGGQGTQWHRLFECEGWKRLRHQYLDQSTLKWALSEGWAMYGMELASLRFADSVFPDFGVEEFDLEEFERFESHLQNGERPGPIYLDGSALWPNVGRIRASGFAVIQVTHVGRCWRAAWGPVPTQQAPKQTALDGEAYALYALARLQWDQQVGVFSDCQRIVDLSRGGAQAALRPQQLHAHLWACMRTWPQVHKVKAHVSPTVARSGLDALHAIGNGLADEYAKRGAKLHGQLEHRRWAHEVYQHLILIGQWAGKQVECLTLGHISDHEPVQVGVPCGQQQQQQHMHQHSQRQQLAASQGESSGRGATLAWSPPVWLHQVVRLAHAMVPELQWKERRGRGQSADAEKVMHAMPANWESIPQELHHT